MKKMIAASLLLLFLLMAGCSAVSEPSQPSTQPTSAPTQVPTTEPTTEPTTVPTTEPEPETVPGTVLYAPAPAVLAVLNRGESVEILEDMGETCRVRFGETTGMMEKRLLRPDSAEDYVPWTGYAQYKAVMFDNFRLSGEGEQLRFNAKLEVIDAYGDCLVIRVDDKTGYVLASDVRKYPYRPQDDEDDDGGGGGDSGGGSSGGVDGGDISLSARPFDGGRYLAAASPLPSLALRLLASTGESAPIAYSGAATVLADGAELVLVWFAPGDQVRVLSADDSVCTIYHEKQTATLARFLVLVDGDEPYTPWEGYAKLNTRCHSDYYLNDPKPERLNVNTVLSVIGELDNCYAVSLDSKCVFIPKESVSETKVFINWGGDDEDDSGGGGGGDSGGGDWSPPAL